jgi:Flp pilus assembly pilin Flp
MKSERGAVMVEYGLILLLIVSVCVAAIAQVGKTALQFFTDVLPGF